jgi:peroxiredoxin
MTLKNTPLILLLAFLTLLMAMVCLKAQSQKFRVEGQIIDAGEISQATIFTFGESKFVKDTVKVANGRFVFEGSVTNPCLAIINTDKVKGGLGIWLTNDEIKANFVVQKYDEGYTLLQPSSVEGSTEAKDYLSQINFHNQIMAGGLNRLTKNLLICEATQEYILTHPKSYLSLFLLAHSMNLCGTSQTNFFFATLDDALKKSDEGVRLVKEIEKIEHNAIGKKVFDFKIPDVDGQVKKLSDVVKGPTIIHFWASWCAPCRRENRELVAYKKLFNDLSVQVIGVSLDEDKGDWLEAIKKDEMDWLQLSELKGGFASNVAQQFKITGIPYILLIDQNLTIQASGFNTILSKIKN